MELIVSLGVFISIMTIGMGAVLQMFGLNQKSQSLKTIMVNLNFALDSMAREIVVAKVKDTNLHGSSLRCGNADQMNVPQDCTLEDGGDDFLTFCNSDGYALAYSFNSVDASIERLISDSSGCPTTFGTAEWQRITAPEVVIENLTFYVSGATNENPGRQPKVLLIVEGEAGVKEDVKSKFEVQTTLSQRTPDLSTVLP